MESNSRVAVGVSDSCVEKIWVTSSGSEDRKVEGVPRSLHMQETVPARAQDGKADTIWQDCAVSDDVRGSAEMLYVHPDVWLSLIP